MVNATCVYQGQLVVDNKVNKAESWLCRARVMQGEQCAYWSCLHAPERKGNQVKTNIIIAENQMYWLNCIICESQNTKKEAFSTFDISWKNNFIAED